MNDGLPPPFARSENPTGLRRSRSQIPGLQDLHLVLMGQTKCGRVRTLGIKKNRYSYEKLAEEFRDKEVLRLYGNNLPGIMRDWRSR